MVEPTWTEIIVVTGDFKGKSEKGLPNNVIKKIFILSSEMCNAVFTNSKPFDFKIIYFKFFYLTANSVAAHKRCLVGFRKLLANVSENLKPQIRHYSLLHGIKVTTSGLLPSVLSNVTGYR